MKPLLPSVDFRVTTFSAAAWMVLAACGDDSGAGGGGGASSGVTTAVSSGAGSTGSSPAATSSSSGQASSGQGGDGAGGDGVGPGTGGAGTGGAGTGTGGAGTGGAGTGGTGAGTGGDGQGGAISCEDVPSTDIPGDACDAVAAALCHAFEECFPFVLTLLTGTHEDCLPWAYGQCLQNNEQPGDPNSAEDYEACAEVAVNAPCGCEVCGPPTPGTQAFGDACMDDSQCASHACRGSEAYIECGTCFDVGGAGDPCSGLDVVCDDGLYCDADSGDCTAKLALGDTCGDSDECLSDVCYEAECIAPLALGDDCSGDGGDGACSLLGDGLWCDPGTQLCSPFPVGQAGDACGQLDDAPPTYGFCAGNLRCSVPFPGVGTCIAKDAEGDDCTLTGDQPNESTCLPHLHCVGGECVVPTPITCQ